MVKHYGSPTSVRREQKVESELHSPEYLSERDKKNWPTYWWAILATHDFRIGIYPDTAKTAVGQKRQVLKLMRIITPLLANPTISYDKFATTKYDKQYGVWEEGWQERMYDYHLVGPSPDYESYVRKARRKNRANFITDDTISIHVHYNGPWKDASTMSKRMANLIAETLRKK